MGTLMVDCTPKTWTGSTGRVTMTAEWRRLALAKLKETAMTSASPKAGARCVIAV
jgi:hypothetical protein